MARRSNADIEKDWYDVFARWNRADREAAMKVLRIVHNTIPDKVKGAGAAVEAPATLDLKETQS